MDDSLSFESFYTGAKKAAHRAMEDHGHKEYDEFALHAGVAVERLAKAVLVSKNPLYIAEMRGSTEMLFHLGGHRTASKVRTIGAMEAIARLRVLDILLPDRQLDLLIDLRNGVAHAASGDQAKGLLPTFMMAVDSLILGVQRSRQDFWGRWLSAVTVALDNNHSKVARDVQVRIRQAKHAFEDRFAGLPEGSMERLQQSQRVRGVGTHIADNGVDLVIKSILPCPACSGRADAPLTQIESTATVETFVTEGLCCPFCGLSLSGDEEMEAAELGGRKITYSAHPAFIDMIQTVTLDRPGAVFTHEGQEERSTSSG
nr:hypothetical protein OG461_20420 [Streptomyces sp. NBC_00995]